MLSFLLGNSISYLFCLPFQVYFLLSLTAFVLRGWPLGNALTPPPNTWLSGFFLLVLVSGRHWHQLKGRRERLRYLFFPLPSCFAALL